MIMDPKRIIVVGASLGGLDALSLLLSGLPSQFQVPLAIVQHRQAAPKDPMIHHLQTKTALLIREVEDKDLILSSCVYVGPAGYHLLVERGCFSLSTDAPVSYSRPSIDVLFDSASVSYGAQTIGVVLTCSSKDGVEGAVKIKERGGILLVQDPKTTQSDVLPRAVIETTNTDSILPLSELSKELVRICCP